MQPVLHELHAERTLALRQLVFMMREDIVHPAGVDIELRAQVAGGHRGALDVPAGETLAPRASPLDHAPRLRRLPEREISLVALQWVHLYPHALEQVLKLVTGKLAVVRITGHVKIDVTLHLVSIAPFQEPLRHLDHLGHVIGGFGEQHRGQNVELRLVLQKGLGVEIRDLVKGLAGGQSRRDHLVLAPLHHILPHVAHVRDVLDVLHPVPMALQQPAQRVRHNIRPHIADVGVAVHRGPAGIHADHAGLDALKFNF